MKKRLIVMLDEKEHLQLQDDAAGQGLNLSNFVRKMLELPQEQQGVKRPETPLPKKLDPKRLRTKTEIRAYLSKHSDAEAVAALAPMDIWFKVIYRRDSTEAESGTGRSASPLLLPLIRKGVGLPV